jgi:hypothetical protein
MNFREAVIVFPCSQNVLGAIVICIDSATFATRPLIAQIPTKQRTFQIGSFVPQGDIRTRSYSELL